MKNIMVCVTLQNNCERLINVAAELSMPEDSLFVLHVAKNGQTFMGGINDGASLEYLYSVSQKVGASMTVLHSDNVIEAICLFVREHQISLLILGIPSKDEKDTGFAKALNDQLGESCKLVLIDKQKGVIDSESIFNSNRT
ncbi:MAG: universal stress protein [Clostridia bacterium]|nr:universal stress protein [Clostridia bacterium]